MPQDFYDFWDFCKEICEEHPENALADIGLKLVGAFDLLSNKFKDYPKPLLGQFLCHWRFYFDPPELQTVLVADENEFHIGYFRDDPAEDPVFLASMSSLKPGIIQPLKEDLFSTVFSFAKSSSCPAKDNAKKEKLLDKLKSFSDRKKYSLSETSARLKGRKKKVVAKGFHGAGIVVPLDKETDVGYREIPETNADLKRIMKKIDEAPSEEKKQDPFEVASGALDERAVGHGRRGLWHGPRIGFGSLHLREQRFPQEHSSSPASRLHASRQRAIFKDN
ncbi:UNVERIFIED_CONTAM: hypothetical protein GTU68_023123 [Idotea baltica]|nr:hypothetical protein [Idotea baltica]